MKQKNKLEDIKILSNELMNKHNLNDWRFKFSNASRRLGSCNKKKKTISVSKLHGLYDDKTQIKDTILHEIAHVLTPKYYSAHGKEWKDNAKKVGCNPISYKKSIISEKFSCKYIGICINCKKKIFLNKRSTYICRSCYNTYSLNSKFNYIINPDYLGNGKL